METLILILILSRGGAPQMRELLPSPDVILRWQESFARERAMAAREAPQAAVKQPVRHALSKNERRALHEALERYFRENPGKIIDARTLITPSRNH